jgi:hypothetical protein
MTVYKYYFHSFTWIVPRRIMELWLRFWMSSDTSWGHVRMNDLWASNYNKGLLARIFDKGNAFSRVIIHKQWIGFNKACTLSHILRPLHWCLTASKGGAAAPGSLKKKDLSHHFFLLPLAIIDVLDLSKFRLSCLLEIEVVIVGLLKPFS